MYVPELARHTTDAGKAMERKVHEFCGAVLTGETEVSGKPLTLAFTIACSGFCPPFLVHTCPFSLFGLSPTK